MKFDFHWPSGSEKTMFKYVDGIPIRATLAERSSKNNDFGFHSIHIINFSKNFPFKCIRKQV